ncbi:MAG TPA: AsmA family protein, partial [Bryobacteraceae bacterium]|nr:AsmA family protein [Bryobacteraceae bacterium]
MSRWLRWPWLLLYAGLILVFAWWYVPQISADRYRERIHTALENALGRRVEMGQVQFQLLPMPGFTIENVEVGEDPSVGSEPMAYVTTLRARLRISALFGGPLEFASVDLDKAYVNLTRVENGDGGVQWNFSSLMRPNTATAFPSVHMNSGRVNFKFGDTKAIFYLLNTDVDLWPPSNYDGPWTLRVRAEPARTDRPARGFGSFSARGEWHPGDKSVTLDVKLEKSELDDMVTLFEGREADLHGHIWGEAHLAGSITRVGMAGRLMVDDIHGWNQTPPGGSAWPLAVGGAIDVPGQTVDIRVTTTGKDSPVDLRYHVAGYLGKPRWAVTTIFRQLPMSPLMGIARNLGWGIPRDMNFEGTAQGVVGYSMPDGAPHFDGALQIANSTLSVGGTPPLRVAVADLQFAGSSIRLSPTSIVNDRNEAALLDGDADVSNGMLEASLTSDGMSIASLRRQISVAAAPLLSQTTAGTWSGSLRYSNAQPVDRGPWSGEVHLKDAEVPFEAFSEPLHIGTADAVIDGAAIAVKKLTVSAGGVEAQGEYRYDPGAVRPHRFRLTAAQTSGAALEKLLMPALHRGNF